MNPRETELLRRHPDLAPLAPGITRAVGMLVDCFRSGGKLLLAGNGGSAADCDHIAGELLKGFLRRRPLPEAVRRGFDSALGEGGQELAGALQGGLPAIPLPALTAAFTAFSNDVDPTLGFAQLVYALGRGGDLLLAISTSGNSVGVVQAAATARAVGMRVIGLTGATGGRLAAHCDCLLNVPERETYLVQECHLPVYHFLCAEVEQAVFGDAP